MCCIFASLLCNLINPDSRSLADWAPGLHPVYYKVFSETSERGKCSQHCKSPALQEQLSKVQCPTAGCYNSLFRATALGKHRNLSCHGTVPLWSMIIQLEQWDPDHWYPDWYPDVIKNCKSRMASSSVWMIAEWECSVILRGVSSAGLGSKSDWI